MSLKERHALTKFASRPSRAAKATLAGDGSQRAKRRTGLTHKANKTQGPKSDYKSNAEHTTHHFGAVEQVSPETQKTLYYEG